MEHIHVDATEVPRAKWRIHLCTMVADAAHQDAVGRDWLIARDWLRDHGHEILAQWNEPLERKLAAAQACDLCILLLGQTFGPCDPRFSFSDAELEVSAAADIQPDKVLVFTRAGSEQTKSPEQREFIVRVGNFAQGTFQPPYHTEDELRSALERALYFWTPPPPHTAVLPLTPAPGAIMISSTGDLGRERATVRGVLQEQGLPVIDYLYEPNEVVTPLDRVLAWARQCRALVLILGARYGYISPLDGFGVTELEFVTALEAQHPVLALVGPGADKTEDKDQQQFLERVRRFVPQTRVLSFSDEATLQQRMRAGLAEILSEAAPSPLPAIPESDQLRWYHRQVRRLLGTVPQLLQPQGMPLEQVYVSLALAPAAAKAEADKDHGEEAKVTTLGADEALKRYPRMVLQGDPGTGKSVALRWYAISTDSSTVPIYIRLGTYAQALERQTVSSLEEFIRQEEHRLLLTSSDDQELWLPLLHTGRGVILLDGLDEVSSRRPDTTSTATADASGSLRYRVTRDILTLAQHFPAIPMVVATRPVDGVADRLTPIFTVLQVQPLNTTQQRQVVLQWLHSAHPESPLISVQIAQRVLDVLEAQHRLRAWATNPLMLTLLTTLIDSGGRDAAVESLSRATLLRRAIRLLLGQWGTLATRVEDDLRGKRRLGGKHLWVKEQLLVRLAWNTLLSGHRQFVSGDDVAAAWQSLPHLAQSMAAASSVVSELSSEDGFLPQVAEDRYAFYHPIFQEYLSAAVLAAPQPSNERLDFVARKRLDETWDETTQLLAGELDRLGRPEAADEVVRLLIEADRKPLSGLTWADPTHLALRRAARVQGNRTADVRGNGTGAALAGAWRQILQRRLDSREDYGPVWTWSPALLNTCQAFLDMGEAAATAAPLFRDLARDVVRQASSEDPFDRTPDPLVQLIEVLGSSGAPEDVALLARLLERDQGIGDPQAAALRGLMRLGPEAVRPFRDLLPRFVYAGSSLRSMIGESGALAAGLLIHMAPTREELEGIRRLGGRWQQEALWAAPLLPLSDAIDILHKAFADGSGHIRGYYDERSRLDFRDDTLNDDRFAALAATSHLGQKLLPLLPDVLFRTTHDTERNRRLAENIVLELGVAAVPDMKSYIADHCRNEELREQYFGRVLVGMETTSDPTLLRSLLAQAIATLREIAEIQDRQWRDYLAAERAERRTPVPREPNKSVSLDQLLERLRGASTAYDPLVRDAIVTQTLDSIGHMGPTAARALDDVRKLAQEQRYRRRAVAALAGLGAAAAPAIPQLMQALSDHDDLVRAHAVEAIGQLGEAARPALPLLGTLLSARGRARADAEVRRQAVVAWGRLFPLSRPFLADVLEIVQKDADMAVRVAGIDALGAVADAEARVLDMLRTLAETVGPHGLWDTDLRSHARVALERMLARAEDADQLWISASSTVRR